MKILGIISIDNNGGTFSILVYNTDTIGKNSASPIVYTTSSA